MSGTSEQPAGVLQGRLDTLQARGRLPGAVAATIGADGVGVVGVSGDAARERQYRIGSITKTLTAVCVLQAREAGLLGLDDPLGRHLPGTAHGDRTLRSLLSHTSGLQSEPVGPWWERAPGVDLATLLERNDADAAVGGTEFHYSNLGYALLGEVVARVFGMPWSDVVSSRLLVPLGMHDTSYGPGPRAAQGYSVEHFAGRLVLEPATDTGAMAPAGQLWSTIDDLAALGGFLLGGHDDVLPRDVVLEMAEPQPGAPEYGLGLWLLRGSDGSGVEHLGHPGSMPGFLASLFVRPGTGDGVVFLANATTGVDTTGLVRELTAERDHVPDPLAPWQPTTRLPAEVAPLLGLWFWGSTAYEARWQNDTLQLRLLQSAALQEVFELWPDGRLVGVLGYHRGETMQVLLRADGAVSHLECATFVYTRVPYDPAAPIPGGVPS